MSRGAATPDPSQHRLVVPPGDARARIDRFLASRLPHLSRAMVQRLIRYGCVLVEGTGGGIRANRPVAAGEVIHVNIPAPSPSGIVPEAIPLDILHEDGFLLVVNKPAGMVVHPGAGSRTGTLVHAIMSHCRDLSGIGGVERPGIVHRLDKDTSGVILVAKDDATHRDLSRQFQSRDVEKVYVALVHGRVDASSGSCDTPLGRDRTQRIRISARTDRPRDALTHYVVLERLEGYTWLELRPKTGRTHQIRVHMKILGHPIVGDPLYGGRRAGPGAAVGLPRLALHALRIGFLHPGTGRSVSFTAPLPGELSSLLDAARGGRA